jgi:hypothetical protein
VVRATCCPDELASASSQEAASIKSDSKIPERGFMGLTAQRCLILFVFYA